MIKGYEFDDLYRDEDEVNDWYIVYECYFVDKTGNHFVSRGFETAEQCMYNTPHATRFVGKPMQGKKNAQRLASELMTKAWKKIEEEEAKKPKPPEEDEINYWYIVHECYFVDKTGVHYVSEGYETPELCTWNTPHATRFVGKPIQGKANARKLKDELQEKAWAEIEAREESSD